MIDYVLNVAVGISAGVAALTSAVPALHPWTLVLCLGVLALVTLLNLRGTLDAGRVFAVPAYLFVASFMALLAIGIWKAAAAGGHPEPAVAPPPLSQAGEAVGLWLLLRAFASGCTAMTGVEAVSNGVAAFREPRVRHGHRTLTAICLTLGLLLGGIAYLAQVYGIAAMDQMKGGYQSILSQLAGAIVGRGWFYYVAIGSLLSVLCLSANTSFTGFPRLCRMVAEDGFLPRPFAIVGRRLVFSVGIGYLAAAAALLLIVFEGITDRLIPLFAIGAFLTFTLSQSGMVVHWRRMLREAEGSRRRHAARVSLAINGLGAVTTALALGVIVAAKFAEGAWITLLVIPGVIILLRAIKSYYRRLDAQLRDEGPLELDRGKAPVVLVATEGWNRLTDKAIGFALQVSPDVYAVHLSKLTGPEVDRGEEALRQQWAADIERPTREAGLRPPRLVLLQAPYRRMHAPLLKLIADLEARYPGRTIAVLVPEIVKRHWWQRLLHAHRARRLRSALLRYGGSELVVMSLPWHLEAPRVEKVIEEEERELQQAAGGKPARD
jgi:amino acid transporter